MPTARNLGNLFQNFKADEHFYWRACDGHCSGTELCWMPVARRWVWYDADANRHGSSQSLTIILTSEIVCDTEHGNVLGDLDLIGLELDNRAMAVVDDLPEGYELPDDAEVFEVGEDGLVAVPLESGSKQE